MHIAEGMLSVSSEGIVVLAAGAAVTAAGTAVGLRKMDYERVPQVAMLSSAFFVASLIQVPLPGASVHLVLNGLIGVILGWSAFPAVLIALLLQAVFAGEGGPTTLGLNTMTMALPAVACYYLFHHAVRWRRETLAVAAGFAAGAVGVLFGSILTATALMIAGEAFEMVGYAVLIAHLPLAVIEGLVTGSVVAFLRKVRPELLEAPLLAPSR
jgi:cobalt/nickel transport system permease protein